jgi:hypothetical protein
MVPSTSCATDHSQFLPQDRVASFAQLNPTQLLHETQRAVGGAEMVAHWERLCKLRVEERELENVPPKNHCWSLLNPFHRMSKTTRKL